MNEASREMTLEEWCAKLPNFHLVNKQLRELHEHKKRDFDAGVVYACAQIIRLHDQPVIATDVFRESGVDAKNAAEYDVSALRVEIEDLPNGCDA